MKKITVGKQLFFLAIILLLLFEGCGKKSSNSTPVDATLKKYFSYKVGTYWIYRDSLRGEIDSFVVLSDNNGSASTNGPGVDYEMERIARYINNINIDSLGCIWKLETNTI